jgi:hypothetical protein
METSMLEKEWIKARKLHIVNEVIAEKETSANKFAVRGIFFRFLTILGLINSMQQTFFIKHLIFQLVKKFVSVEA